MLRICHRLEYEVMGNWVKYDVTIIADPACAVPSKWFVLKIRYPGRLKFEKLMKCVSKMNAMSILLF